MSKGTGTRSGLLWEVERILNECANLPQVLLMENVPQVHSAKNLPDFEKWQEFLRNKGYTNYWKDLNAKNYGVAQNRNRCFMISFLEYVKFSFPDEIPLEKKMKDYLEEVVDEKYYINNEKANQLIKKLSENNQLKVGQEACDMTVNKPNLIDAANCICARYDCGISNYRQSGVGVFECKKKD